MTSPVHIKADCYYRTRSGRKAWVAHVLGPSPFDGCVPRSYSVYGYIQGNMDSSYWTASGFTWEGNDGANDLVAEWRDPVTVEGWVNVYQQGGPWWTYPTRAEADLAAGSDRLACVRVTGQEEPCP